MSTWPTDAVYIAKFNPNTGYFNDFFDRNDDLLKLPAIQIAEPGSNDPSRDYLAFVEGISGNKNVVLKLYQSGAIELSDGNKIESIVLSDGNFSDLGETQLLSARAVLQLVTDRLSDNDILDEAARSAVSAALTAVTNTLDNKIDQEIARASTSEALLHGEVDQLELDLSEEQSRAIAAEAALQVSISEESLRATTSESLLQGSIDQLNNSILVEVSRAVAAEADLRSSIDAVPDLIQSAISDNDVLDAAAIEVVRAALESTDIATQSALTAEVSRAIAAEELNALAIAAETQARTAALAGIDLSGIATNAAAILAESNRAVVAEQSNTSAIESEVLRATLAETNLQAGIDSNRDLILALEGGADIAQVTVNTQAIAANSAAIQNESSAREASDLLLQADILTLSNEFDNLLSSSIPASYLLKIDGNDVVISTDGVSTGTDDPNPDNLTAIQELYAQINNLITQALPSSSIFRAIGNDFVVSGFLQGHAGGSLIEFSTGDIILPTEPTGFPESSFRLSDDYTEIIFGE